MKKRSTRDYRSRANKAERLFAKAVRMDRDDAIVAMRKGLSMLRKACRKKQVRHARKYGYAGGLRSAVDAADGQLERALGAHGLPPDYFLTCFS